MQQNFLQILMRAMVLVAVIPIHECAHGLAASWMGDHTARDLGRTTLNPLAHLAPIGSLALVFTVTVPDCICAVAASTDCVAFLVLKATAANTMIIQKTDIPNSILCR